MSLADDQLGLLSTCPLVFSLAVISPLAFLDDRDYLDLSHCKTLSMVPTATEWYVGRARR